MAYGDTLVTTDGPSYGQPIVRNVGVGGGGGAPDAHAASHENGGSDELDLTGLSGGFQNPYPDPAMFNADVDFLEDIEMRDEKTLWLDTAKTVGLIKSAEFAGRGGLYAGDITYVGALAYSVLDAAVWEAYVQNAGSAAYVNLKLEPTLVSLILSGAVFSIAGGPTILPASVAGYAPLRVTAGVAPSSPTNGDIWVDAAGDMFLRRAGVSKQFAFV